MASELGVYNAAPQVIPVTLEVLVARGQEFIILIIGKRQRGVRLPHGVKLEHLLVPVDLLGGYGIDIGDIADAISRYEPLEGERVDVGRIDCRGITGRASHVFLPDPVAQASNVAGHGGRRHGMLPGAPQVVRDLIFGQGASVMQDQDTEHDAFLTGDRFLGRTLAWEVTRRSLHDRETHVPPVATAGWTRVNSSA